MIRHRPVAATLRPSAAPRRTSARIRAADGLKVAATAMTGTIAVERCMPIRGRWQPGGDAVDEPMPSGSPR